jgi:hypothetical protein
MHLFDAEAGAPPFRKKVKIKKRSKDSHTGQRRPSLFWYSWSKTKTGSSPAVLYAAALAAVALGGVLVGSGEEAPGPDRVSSIDLGSFLHFCRVSL